MKLSTYCLCAVLALGTTTCKADDILIELAYNPGTSTWQLFGAVVDGTPDTADGSNGIAAMIFDHQRHRFWHQWQCGKFCTRHRCDY